MFYDLSLFIQPENVHARPVLVAGPLLTGVPLLRGVLAAIECAVERRVTAGDHDIFVAEMVAARVHEGEPLIHFARRYRRLAE